MSRRMRLHRVLFASLSLSCAAAAWWGCSATSDTQTTEGGASQTTTAGTGGTAGMGGIGGNFDGSAGSAGGEACTAIEQEATRIRLDMIFLIDRSQSMSGLKWDGTTAALTEFVNDPASIGIGVGLSFSPNDKDLVEPCNAQDYVVLGVPIDVLPDNAFAITNALPADAKGDSSPTYGSLKGTLMAATAQQDAYPTRKVVVVLATDEGPNSCGGALPIDVANLAASARNYNGVLTYVIAVEGADLSFLNQIAAAGGTLVAYDVTTDISQFAATIEDIRGKEIGCEFEIPVPEGEVEIDPDKVNFAYTPQGMGEPKILLKAMSPEECENDPGWYFDNNFTPTKIILCPASCATVQNDSAAKVKVLFGCKSLLK